MVKSKNWESVLFGAANPGRVISTGIEHTVQGVGLGMFWTFYAKPPHMIFVESFLPEQTNICFAEAERCMHICCNMTIDSSANKEPCQTP